jgi:phospholipase C
VFVLSDGENDVLFDDIVPPIPPPCTPAGFVNRTSPADTEGDGLWVGGGCRMPRVVISPGPQAAGHRMGTSDPPRSGSSWHMTSVFRCNERRIETVLPDTASAPLTLSRDEATNLLAPGDAQPRPPRNAATARTPSKRPSLPHHGAGPRTPLAFVVPAFAVEGRGG